MEKEKPNEEASDLAQGLAARLERRFGLGNKPDVRRGLYERLQLAVEVHGQQAFTALRTVAAEAAGKRKPDRYFCRAAICRLRETGLMPLADL